MSSRFMKGALILSLSTVLARLLGLIYIVPFEALVGPGGLALYAYAYGPYSFFLMLSTLGIPVGIAKFIAKYNADGEYDTSRRIYQFGLLFMIILGIVSFLIMYFGAPIFANMVISRSENTYNTFEDVVSVIRVVSFAIIVIPPMSIMRGFFQGNQDMSPTAVSQVIEQLVRVILIVIGAYIVVRFIPHGNVQMAVRLSVFAAFIAGIAALIVLNRYWVKNRKKFNDLLSLSTIHEPRSMKKLFLELLSYALPFAILSIAATLFQLIDLVTFNRGMVQAGVDMKLSEQIMGIYSTSLSKIVMIPVSFAIAFGQPLVTELTEKMRIKDMKSVHQTLSTALVLTSFITVPAVIGMSLLSSPIYVLLFNRSLEINQIGGQIFGFGAFIGLFLAFNSITAAVIQGIGRHYQALIYLAIAAVIKLVGNIILIPIFQVNGAILSTLLAFGFCIILNYFEIRKTTGIQTRFIIKRHLSILSFTGVMSITVGFTIYILNLFLDYSTSRGIALIYVTIAGIVGVVVYFGLAFYFDLTKQLFGDRLSIKRIFKRIGRRKT